MSAFLWSALVLISYRLYITKEVNIMKHKNSEKGVTTVEYAVMLVLIAIAVMGSNPGIASAVTNVFVNMAGKLNG